MFCIWSPQSRILAGWWKRYFNGVSGAVHALKYFSLDFLAFGDWPDAKTETMNPWIFLQLWFSFCKEGVSIIVLRVMVCRIDVILSCSCNQHKVWFKMLNQLSIIRWSLLVGWFTTRPLDTPISAYTCPKQPGSHVHVWVLDPRHTSRSRKSRTGFGMTVYFIS